METDEGVVAGEACSWYTRKEHNWPCMVYKDGSEAACAYCKRNGKSGCGASLAASPPSDSERITTLEAQVAALQAELAEYKGYVDAISRHLAPGWRPAAW